MYPRINTERKKNKNILSTQIYQHQNVNNTRNPLILIFMDQGYFFGKIFMGSAVLLLINQTL